MDQLPRGIRLDHSYIQVRVTIGGRLHCKNFGKDSPAAREAAFIYLGKMKEKIAYGKAGVIVELPSLSFKDAANLYFREWSKEKDANGVPRHNENSAYHVRLRLDNSLIPYFGKMKIEDILPKDVEAWRLSRLATVSGSTANREQGILASVFSHLEMWVTGKKVRAFKLPEKNPATGKAVEKSPIVKRDRLVTEYEMSKLKLAARELGDENGRENICLALITILSAKDLKKLKFGDLVALQRSKTGADVNMPITVWYHPNWKNWRSRWEAIRAKAGILDIEWRDLRKAGGNLLNGQNFDPKLVSQYHGHKSIKTTEAFYTKVQTDKLRPLADFLIKKVQSL